MYTIRQVAELTGFSPDTLRYYEKIGLLKSPQRGSGGVRTYSDDDVHQVTSVNCLKKTGLSLDDIKEFIQEGQCFHNSSSMLDPDDIQTISSRSQILSEHLNTMENQRRELDDIINQTRVKLNYYNDILNGTIKLEEVKENSK
ncbi:MerR family transcriptional regulator [Paenibacillus sp. GP183]|uniref:MerR family transcriptional regulator n=1 Tax=Paenibacillus sp. GP183 TaxID=1882751 RepID=UPI00089940AC|nr:MerR family transcriptional regulator [Paenibacillus sp. GP183]SEB98647.1 transcriptional regulator, MerR family [Paenibacillus sp. GP183]